MTKGVGAFFAAIAGLFCVPVVKRDAIDRPAVQRNDRTSITVSWVDADGSVVTQNFAAYLTVNECRRLEKEHG